MANIRYQDAVHWVAHNDDESELDLEAVKMYISTALVADLFGKTVGKVAADILKERLSDVV